MERWKECVLLMRPCPALSRSSLGQEGRKEGMKDDVYCLTRRSADYEEREWNKVE